MMLEWILIIFAFFGVTNLSGWNFIYFYILEFRHESRLLQAYAENWISKDKGANVYDVLNKFYANQLAVIRDYLILDFLFQMTKEVSSNLSPLHTRRVHPLLWPWDQDMYEFTSDVENNVLIWIAI